MLPTLDYRDYFVIGFLSFFVLSLIISTCIWRKTTDDPKEPYADENYLISLFFIFIFLFIPPLCWYGDLPVGDFITATTVNTTDYKTVYKNNQGIDIEIKDATNYHIVLPSILNTTDISAESIDPKAPDDNYFIFSKNGVKESDERLTETVIAKDSPLKKDDPTGTKRIERIEFAKRAYRFKLWNYSTTRTENIARVTVSYQPDPQKTKKEKAYQEIKNLMNN